MKFLEMHFEDYINSSNNNNLHPKMKKIFSMFPKKMENMGNLIFYGPSGVGKYTQMLMSIKNYSPSELKYEKKLGIVFNKNNYCFKISDIHYEVDMSLLGCNSKLLWYDIYSQIVDIVSAKTDKCGIIVCKEFHHIHNELLENFYSYMQFNTSSAVCINFIFLTEEISFIPDNILNCSEVIHFVRPTKQTYINCLKKIPSNLNINKITNIKSIGCENIEIMHPYQMICNKIIKNILSIDNVNFLQFRDMLYDIFIYNLNINECIWYILHTLIENNKINKKHISTILLKTNDFLKYYNNNYRPIYHLESYLYNLVSIINEY